LVPLLGFAALVTGAGLSGAFGFTAVAVLATAFALALGSFQSALEAQARRAVARPGSGRTRAAARPPALDVARSAAIR